MKPEWFPQWAWDEAERLADVSSEYWHDIYWGGQFDITLNEHVVRALLSAKREGMGEAAKLLDEGYSREVGHHYRKDRQPSKHDRCPHGRYTYEDCESCGAAAIRAKANEVKT